jgi:uncharacterized protein with HEPN domain
VKDDRVYLEHIRDAINDIIEYTQSGRDAFFADRMRQDATIRKLEVIGQAVKHRSDGCKSRRPEIPWKQIAGMRNRDIANVARATCLGAPRDPRRACSQASTLTFSLLSARSARTRSARTGSVAVGSVCISTPATWRHIDAHALLEIGHGCPHRLQRDAGCEACAPHTWCDGP